MSKKKNTPKKDTKTSEQVKPQSTQKESKKADLAFAKENYILLIVGIVIIAIGFLLMIGGSSDDPKVFNPDIFSFRRITLAPILVLIGFAIEIYAIMKKPKEQEQE